MRTMRLSLAGTVILALLGGLSVAVVAQDPVVATGPEHAWVDFVSEDCADLPGAPVLSRGNGDGTTWIRGAWGTCEMAFSDPRVSGTMTGDYNDDCFGGYWPCVVWGTEEISGPDGTWSGWYHGISPADGQQTTYHVMTGSGGYGGLTFVWDWTRSPEGPSGSGFIYEGTPPPQPEFVMPVTTE
jgi:hypothetical protein